MSARRLRLRVVTSPLNSVQRFVAFSLLAHALLTAVLVWVPGIRRRTRIPADATVVELVGALPAARPPAPAAPAPQPEPVAEPPASPPKKKPPDQASLAPEKTEPRPEPVEPRPEPVEPPRDEAGSERPAEPVERPADQPTAGSSSEGASVSAIDLGDSAFAWYRAAVANALYGNWRRPVLSGLREPVEVRVAFEIMRDGNVRGLRVELPSGVPMLDRSALRAVGDATPLPALPASLHEPYLPASIVFRLYPEGY
ncbi:MAG TPA: TonB family protein [Candidatus Polarisedimenticolaceae bacterium]|nr:TonB family protein [Candidatus Polarisedimenticolaceae bacterium]